MKYIFLKIKKSLREICEGCLDQLPTCCCLQLCRLIRDCEGIEDIFEIPHHDDWKIREILIDPMIGESILWEVVGTDFLTAVS